MGKRKIETDGAPRAIGPYSQAIRAGDLLFVSGQLPIDPATGELLGGDISGQTRRVMDNLAAVLQKAGAGFDRVVKATVYLTDLSSFAQVNEVYGGYFASEPPARVTVEVSALPRGASVEIDLIAYLGA